MSGSQKKSEGKLGIPNFVLSLENTLAESGTKNSSKIRPVALSLIIECTVDIAKTGFVLFVAPFVKPTQSIDTIPPFPNGQTFISLR